MSKYGVCVGGKYSNMDKRLKKPPCCTIINNINDLNSGFILKLKLTI